MDESNNNLDIFYQINSYDDIQEYNLDKIKDNPYFLIESKKINQKKITFEFIENLLINDGINISQIQEYRYLTEEEKNGETNIILQTLNKDNLDKLKHLKQIYIHLIMEEDTEIPENDEMDEYNNKIEKYEQNFEEILDDIRKEEIYKNKVFCNSFKNIVKNSLEAPLNSIKLNECKTMVNLQPYESFSDINDDIDDYLGNLNFSSNDIFNDNNLNLNLSLEKQATNLEIVRKNSFQFDKKEKDYINLCYLYSNPLLLKDYKDNDCFKEIVSIYNIFQKSKIPAELKFEPAINDFNKYLESTPDIIHINVNSTLDKDKLLINLDSKGDLRYYSCEDLTKVFETEYGLSKIKLLILSTQNIKEMKKFFKNIGIKNIIYIENKITYPEPNEQKENFIKEFYRNLLIENLSIQESFEKSQSKISDKSIVEIFPSPKNRNDYIFSTNKRHYTTNNKDKFIQKFYSEKNVRLKEKNKHYIKLNKNCSLNLNFVKYNYREIIGRNIELKNCIDKIYRYNNVCVCGYSGVGKKSFVQLVGKFAFERNMYQEIFYIEIYDLKNADEILINKKNKIIECIKIDEDNELEFEKKKILLIINLDYIILDENDIFTFEELINRIQDKNFNYLYAFTISRQLSFSNIKKKLLRTPLIELDKLSDQGLNLFRSITYNLKKKELSKRQKNALVKKTNGYPNDIYLRALYINCCYDEINNIDFDILTNENIFNKLIEKYGKKFKKIISIFTFLKLGIREDILPIFFNEEEIEFIKKELNYLIFVEIDEKGNNYYIDSSFKNLILEIFQKKYLEELSNYLISTLKYYAIIFRYLVNHTNYPYNICYGFHAGVKSDFWFSLNESIYNKDFIKEYKDFENKRIDIYFDEVKYYNNILNIFIENKFVDIMKNNLNNCKEYISQISICLPTILHFQNSYIYRNRICELLIKNLRFLTLNKSLLRLKIFMYWFTGDSKIKPNDKDLESNLIKDKKNKEINKLNNDLKIEICLIKVYDFIKEKDRENLDISDIYEECKNCCKENKNNFNLAKLNLLYSMALKNKNNKKYLDNALKCAKDDNNKYMEILSLIMKADYYLSKYDFNKFNELIAQCEKEIKKNSFCLQNTDINYRLDKVINDKNTKYERYTRNKLFFFASTPFFDEKGNPLKTESNNSFYLKYNLTTLLSKNLQIEFKNIEKNFLKDLEKCLNNPVRFIYIGSDLYNDEGDLFYTNDLKGFSFDSKLIKEILEKSKNVNDIVILGFLNSEKISEYFTNKFSHIIYFKEIKELNKLFKEYPYYYFYFQRCFYTFITDFLLKLSKKKINIKEAFEGAYNSFIMKFVKIIDYNSIEEEKDRLIDMLSKRIIIIKSDKNKKDETFFDDFEDVNNNLCSSQNFINNDNKNKIGKKNSLQRKNLYYNEEIKGFQKEKERKYFQFIKFPGGDLLSEYFEKLYDNRIYGMKELLKELIIKIKKYRYINLYGDISSGKTRLCRELCKYFFMNNNFKEGIYYIKLDIMDTIINREELKELRKKSHNKNDKVNDALLIFDDLVPSDKIYSFINKLNSYIVIVTKDKQKDFLDNYNQLFNKNNNIGNKIKENYINNINQINNDDIYVNVNKPIDKDFAKEFINYMKIINDIKENNNIDNIMINNNNDIYVNHIVEKIKEIIKENQKNKKKILTSSRIYTF